MILDFITKLNNVTYNNKFAKLFGVYSAIYLNFLMDYYILNQEDYIKLSRLEIYNLTAIEEEKQLEVEQNLLNYNLIEIAKVKNSNNKNWYKLNIDLLEKIIQTDSCDQLQEELIVQADAFKKATKPPSSVSKRASIIANLKTNIKTSDPECKSILSDWVDAVYQKTGYLSKQAIIFMEEQLLSYSNNNLTLFKELCKLAARVAYKDPKWVITKYEQENNTTLHLNDSSQSEINANIEQLKNYKGESF